MHTSKEIVIIVSVSCTVFHEDDTTNTFAVGRVSLVSPLSMVGQVSIVSAVSPKMIVLQSILHCGQEAAVCLADSGERDCRTMYTVPD